jgi:hypothetical protein
LFTHNLSYLPMAVHNSKWGITMKCETCGKEGAIKAGIPEGKNECPDCRKRTGNCRICGANRNDCCCWGNEMRTIKRVFVYAETQKEVIAWYKNQELRSPNNKLNFPFALEQYINHLKFKNGGWNYVHIHSNGRRNWRTKENTFYGVEIMKVTIYFNDGIIVKVLNSESQEELEFDTVDCSDGGSCLVDDGEGDW